jgi:hypothetical protein
MRHTIIGKTAEEERQAVTHYQVGGMETVDFIKAKNLGFLAGNVVKYMSRYQYKGTPLDDLYKAQHYLEMLIAEELRRIGKEEGISIALTD